MLERLRAGRLHEPQPARRRAHGRRRRDRRRGPGLRRRPAPRARSGLRIAQPGEHLGGRPARAAGGRDRDRGRAAPGRAGFGETARGPRRRRPRRRRITLCAVQVPGVPDISVEEALWTAAGILTSGERSGRSSLGLRRQCSLLDFGRSSGEEDRCQTLVDGHITTRCGGSALDGFRAPSLLAHGTSTRRPRAARCASRSRKLERELAALFASAYPRRGLEWQVGSPGGPRVLGVGELEELRDDARGAARGRRGAPCATAAYVEREERRADRGDAGRARSASSGCGSRTRTSASRAASTGTRARASA